MSNPPPSAPAIPITMSTQGPYWLPFRSLPVIQPANDPRTIHDTMYIFSPFACLRDAREGGTYSCRLMVVIYRSQASTIEAILWNVELATSKVSTRGLP